jgi:hypothetical protein
MGAQRKKILVVLTTKEYMNNYLYTDALDLITEKYQVKILIPETLFEFVPKHKTNLISTMPETVFKLHDIKFAMLTDIYRRKYRHRSKSFAYREKRTSDAFKINIRELRNQSIEKLSGDIVIFVDCVRIALAKESNATRCMRKMLFPEEVKKTFTSIIKFISVNLGLLKASLVQSAKQLFVKFMALGILTNITQLIYSRNFKASTVLQDYLSDNEFNLVILPSAAFEPVVIQLAEAKAELDYKFLMIVDNWDNLSSKTVLWRRPDIIATWGKQSSQHASKIQGFPLNDVYEIGTARFSNHIKSREIYTKIASKHSYVLFVGTFLEFNEQECLRILNDEICRNPDIYGNLKILYRPHPFASKKDDFEIRKLPAIELDQEVINYKSSPINLALDFEKTLENQKNARFIVGGLTSMLIESSILGKNFLALVHEEKGNPNSPDVVRSSYEHFSGIESLPNVFFVHDLELLSTQFREIFYMRDLPQPEIDNELSFFYDLRPLTFAERLDELLIQLKF